MQLLEETIVSLDEDEGPPLASILASFSASDFLPTLGVWTAKGGVTWENFQYLLMFMQIRASPRPAEKEETYLPLVVWMTENEMHRGSLQNGAFMYRAQQSYRIIMAYFSEAEQHEILSRLGGIKEA